MLGEALPVIFLLGGWGFWKVVRSTALAEVRYRSLRGSLRERQTEDFLGIVRDVRQSQLSQGTVFPG